MLLTLVDDADAERESKLKDVGVEGVVVGHYVRDLQSHAV